jgi:hypothetical protein
LIAYRHDSASRQYTSKNFLTPYNAASNITKLKDIKVNAQFLSPIGASAAPGDGWDPARASAIATRLHGVGKPTPLEKAQCHRHARGWAVAGSESVKNGSVSEANLAK